MGANPDTKLQVNINTPSRTLINVYAVDGPELAGLLSDLSDVAPLITETEALFSAVSAVQPIAAPTQYNTQAQPSAAPQQGAQGGPPKPAQSEFCQHGEMTWFSGIAKNTGNPYGIWNCPAGKPPAGCESRWPKRGR